MKRYRILSLLTVLLLVLSMLELPAFAYDIRNVKAPASASRIVYGYSGAGRELVAYKFGNGSNVLVVGFELHGYEDNFDKDGGCLVYTADQLMKLLDQNRARITDYGWTVYVLPSMNPDGLIDGYTCDGPGRCTTSYLNANGQLVRSTGVDLNRSFPTNWAQYSTPRYFNGPKPLSSKEAQALAKFVQDVKGSGRNVCLDVHGWYTQIITSTGRDGTLFQTFSKRFPQNTFASCVNAVGYFTAYTTSLGYQSCLFEFPDGLHSMNEFLRSGYCESFNACVLDLMKSLGVYNGHSLSCASAAFSDVIPWAWYHSSVDYVVDQGIFNGLSKTQFAPNTTMNRAMLVTTLWRMSADLIDDTESSVADPVDDPNTPAETEISFSDVADGKWYSEAVQWAAENGIVNGMPDGTFRPLDPLTREQMATIFYRYAQWCGRSVETQQSLSAFPDAGSVSSYARTPVQWACGIGLIQGVSSGGQTKLQPKGTATRAQAAAIIMRYIEGAEASVPKKTPEICFEEPIVYDGPTADSGN